MTFEPPKPELPVDPQAAYHQMMDMLGQMLAPIAQVMETQAPPKDRRFQGAEWDHPLFALVRQGYATMSDHMMSLVDAAPVTDDQERAKLRFAMRTVVDAMSPANSPFTNPVALQKAVETNGASLVTGMQHMMADLQSGQLTHTDPEAFKLGENIATTPGKVVYQTPLFQLIQYTPATESVLTTPLLIFPPWINRFYILDLTPQKSFIKWCVDQGITVFVVSWKSADASMADTTWDDYIAAQVEAIDTVRDLLGVEAVHTIGYCVAGTTLAATLAVLAARRQADKVKSATFFTAQVDFAKAGELLNFVDEAQIKMVEGMATDGYLDGRFLAATFNLLRGNDLIWSTVTKNYLMGEPYPAFDLLHWNGDVTNLPAKWHKSYLCDLYRDNLLSKPGSLSALGVPIDLTKVKTPSFIQAGREDHIAPAESVWELRNQFSGDSTFLLAGSGHIAGVVNPPSAQKYQYWTNDAAAGSFAQFVACASETKGSWWPYWRGWLTDQAPETVKADGARMPGEGKLSAIEDAPGTYVKTR